MIEDPTPRTPQEAAEGFRQAMIERAWARAMSYLTREMQEGLVGGVCMGTAYALDGDREKGESFAAVLDRHGLLGQKQLPASADIAVIFCDVMDWIDANLDGEQQFDLPGSIAAGVYSDFRVEGDRAYAKLSRGEQTHQARFSRVDSFWYVSG